MSKPSSSAAPIDALPIELLQHIFTLTTDGPWIGASTRGPRESTTNLLGVCSHWRLAALSLPSLWASLLLPSGRSQHSTLVHSLGRLSAFPNVDLHISLHSETFRYAPRKDRQRLATFLRNRRAAWRTLYLELLDVESMAILFRGAEPADGSRSKRKMGCMQDLSRVEELTIRGGTFSLPDGQLSDLGRVLVCMPKLRKLTPVNVDWPPAVALHLLLPQLEALDLTECWRSHLVPLSWSFSALSALTTLRALCLSSWLLIPEETAAGHTKGQQLHLPYLRILVIRTRCHAPGLVTLIQLLRVPRLIHLQVHTVGCRSWIHGDEQHSEREPMHAVTQKQEQEHWGLQTLDMNAPHWHAKDLVNLLSGPAQQAIKCLVVDEAGVLALVQSGLTAEPGLGNGKGGVPWLAPELQELVVLRGWECIRAVLDLVQMRATASSASANASKPVARIRTVRLLGEGCSASPRSQAGQAGNTRPHWGRGSDVQAEEALLELVEVYGAWAERPEGFLL